MALIVNARDIAQKEYRLALDSHRAPHPRSRSPHSHTSQDYQSTETSTMAGLSSRTDVCQITFLRRHRHAPDLSRWPGADMGYAAHWWSQYQLLGCQKALKALAPSVPRRTGSSWRRLRTLQRHPRRCLA